MAGTCATDDFGSDSVGKVGGNGKAQPDTARALATCRGNRHVNPNELAIAVEQRTTRITRVDRCVGLDHGQRNGGAHHG